MNVQISNHIFLRSIKQNPTTNFSQSKALHVIIPSGPRIHLHQEKKARELPPPLYISMRATFFAFNPCRSSGQRFSKMLMHLFTSLASVSLPLLESLRFPSAIIQTCVTTRLLPRRSASPDSWWERAAAAVYEATTPAAPRDAQVLARNISTT